MREAVDTCSMFGDVGLPETKHGVHLVKEGDVLVSPHFELVSKAFFHRGQGFEAFSNVLNGSANLVQVRVQSLEISMKSFICCSINPHLVSQNLLVLYCFFNSFGVWSCHTG